MGPRAPLPPPIDPEVAAELIEFFANGGPRSEESRARKTIDAMLQSHDHRLVSVLTLLYYIIWKFEQFRKLGGLD